ncbi:hypothetical protein HMPREF9098_2462 [Kingella denitrificans ATCC 33394]|uniref:Uncharacterized protein n=1 Tax=Kingella denitrificans ATCC 33394 TaxID=888741 RepID=F0F2X7_9NEIS|nr:hypothetical protein HMPREF9098_2462 [Kingella denitrificans ATCC 33394]
MNDSAIFSFEKSSLHFSIRIKSAGCFQRWCVAFYTHINCPTKHIRASQAPDSWQKQPALYSSGAKKWCGIQSTPKHTHIKRKI